MILSRARKTFLLAVAAATLLGTLAFLFARTQASGYKDDLQALNLLRELRDMDARWDADALRLANDLGSAPAAVADRSPVIARIFQELGHGQGRSAIGAQVPQLRTGMAEKEAALRLLRARHSSSLGALATVREALALLATEASALRGRDARSADGVGALLSLVEQVGSALRSADIEYQADIERAVEPRLASLAPAALALDPKLAGAAGRAEGAARALLAARAAEADAWRKVAFFTVGSHVERLGQGLSRSIEETMDEKDRWRAYLFAYAAALLLGVGYLGLRVVSTQAQLREANAGLEKRVAERTRDLRATLEQLKESEAQLVQSEKMSSLGQLVAGVAHEINTPLAYVKNSVATVRDRMPELRGALASAERLLALLQSESPDAAELQAAFAGLSGQLAQLERHQVLHDLDGLTRDGMHGIEQISELVTGLRNFSRLDRSRIASFNVNEGVNAALLIAKPALRKVDVEKSLADVPSITCSPSQVNQVLLNLVTNAAQAMDKPRGLIAVTTRLDGMDYIAIEIADNGRGIAPEALQKIFDPFYTTKEPGKGTGLGLSIAYKIVAQHGGRIDVRSEQGSGSTFVVKLPIRPAAEQPEAAEQAA